MENIFFIVLIMFLLVPQNIILYFRLHYFHVSNSSLYLHSTLVFSFYIDAVLSLSTRSNPEESCLKYLKKFHLYMSHSTWITSHRQTEPCVLLQCCLTHWGQDKIDAIIQTFSKNFPEWKCIDLIYNFTDVFFPRDQFTIFQHWFR